MPTNITRGDYDQLAQIAQRFTREHEAAQRTLDDVTRQMNTLQGGDWIGDGARAFYAEMSGSVLPSLKRLSQALQSAQRITAQISREIKQAEDEAAALLKDNTSDIPAAKDGGGGKGLFGQIGGFFEGLYEGGKGMVEGLWHVVTDPIGTVKGLAYGITHPAELWEALKKPYVEDWQSGNQGRAIGRGAFEVLALLIPGVGEAKAVAKGAEVAGTASKVSKLAEAANLVAKGEKLAETATVASKLDKAADISKVAKASETIAGKTDDVGRVFGGRGYLPLESPNEFGTVRGVVSNRPFFPDEIGLPIEKLSTRGVQVTSDGIQEVTKHLSRFGDDVSNQAAIQRLQDIANGKLKPTQYDLNFYTHELREFERYKALGYETGVPKNADEAYRLWNNTHSATLEDYRITDADIYHPSLPKD